MSDSDQSTQGVHRIIATVVNWEAIQYDYLGNTVCVETDGRPLKLYCQHQSCEKWLNIEKYYLDDETPFTWGHVQCPTCNIKYEFDKSYPFKAFDKRQESNDPTLFEDQESQQWINELRSLISL